MNILFNVLENASTSHVDNFLAEVFPHKPADPASSMGATEHEHSKGTTYLLSIAAGCYLLLTLVALTISFFFTSAADVQLKVSNIFSAPPSAVKKKISKMKSWWSLYPKRVSKTGKYRTSYKFRNRKYYKEKHFRKGKKRVLQVELEIAKTDV